MPRPRDYGYTDSLTPGSGCLDSPRIDTPEAAVFSMEMAGGSRPAEIHISRSPDRQQTELSVATTGLAGGSPPADIDICMIPDVLPIAMSREGSDVRQVDGDGYSGRRGIQNGNGRWKSSG